MRGPVEPGQYTSDDYTQTLDDPVLARSLGSTGDCCDNALAESFVDSFKTELISDRVWRTHDPAELAIVEWVGLVQLRPAALLARRHPTDRARAQTPPRMRPNAPIAVNGSVATISPKPANCLSTPPILSAGALQRANGQQQRLSAQASPPAENLAVSNGNEATAIALPPKEMTSYGQPANGSQHFDLPRGLHTFPQAPYYWREDRTERLKQRHVNDRGTHLTQSPSNPGWSTVVQRLAPTQFITGRDLAGPNGLIPLRRNNSDRGKASARAGIEAALDLDRAETWPLCHEVGPDISPNRSTGSGTSRR